MDSQSDAGAKAALTVVHEFYMQVVGSPKRRSTALKTAKASGGGAGGKSKRRKRQSKLGQIVPRQLKTYVTAKDDETPSCASLASICSCLVEDHLLDHSQLPPTATAGIAEATGVDLSLILRANKVGVRFLLISLPNPPVASLDWACLPQGLKGAPKNGLQKDSKCPNRGDSVIHWRCMSGERRAQQNNCHAE